MRQFDHAVERLQDIAIPTYETYATRRAGPTDGFADEGAGAFEYKIEATLQLRGADVVVGSEPSYLSWLWAVADLVNDVHFVSALHAKERSKEADWPGAKHERSLVMAAR
jgi:hypothetical protein